MVKVKNENNIINVSDVKSDVSSDVVKTKSDVGQSKYVEVQIPQDFPLSDLHNPYKKNKRRGNDLNAYFVGHLVQRNQYKRNNINEFIMSIP